MPPKKQNSRVSQSARQEVQRRMQARKDYPLAYSSLWHQPLPKTSQRTAAQISLGPQWIAFVNGGNRAGKTVLGAQWAIAHALGRDNAIVQQWAARNHLDISNIQRRPGVVWSVALTFSDSMRYVRAALDRFMPIGTVRRNWKAENEAEAILPGGGRIICKAWSQGRGGFQGDAIHAAWVDEEPTNEPAWNELLMRLADYRGRVLISFTPGLMGKTWVYERYCKEPHPDVAQYSIYGTDNPRGDPAHLRKILGGYTANERAARERGEWVNRDGMVYKVWTRHLHVVRSFPIPKEWKRFRGIDFGFKDPFACVWVARDPQDGQLHLYRLLYQSEKTNQQNGADINRLSTGEVIEWSVADSASAEGRSALNQQCGIATHPADKAIEDGIAVMTSYLAIGANGVPGLVVHDCCTEFIKEIEGYFWTKSGPADINNHALDALRYLLKRLNKADRMRDYVG